MPLEGARAAIYNAKGKDALSEFDSQVSQIQSAVGGLKSDAVSQITSWATEHGFTKEEAALYATAVGVVVAIGAGATKLGKLSDKDTSGIIGSLEQLRGRE